MGDSAFDILTTMKIDEDKATFQELVSAFNTYYNTRKNVIIDRAKFNKRNQRQGEPIEEFIQDLHKLASECNFGALKDELIRDRIVVGVADDALSDELQSKAELTLEIAMQLSRQSEARKESRPFIRGDSSVDYMAQNKSKNMKMTYRPQHNKETCGYCGHEPHRREKCPAKRTVCSKCNKVGHYQAVCRSSFPKRNFHNKPRRVHELSEKEDSDTELAEVSFLGHVFSLQDEEHWSEEILVNNKPHRFKLDTGASVSVVGEKWASSQTLRKSSKSLRGPGGTKLVVIGAFQAQLSHKDKRITETLYVIKGQTCSLLSRSACSQLGLVARILEVRTNQTNFHEEFPELFKGLGKLDKPYHITVDPNVKPVCIYSPRKIPHPLKQKVQKEIEDMEKRGVISRVTEPTSWCSGIVAVPKQDGAVRICADLTQLNKAVRREPHPMFTVEESLAKLSGSKIFSKLDAKSGFWQIPLTEESKPLTTFITPIGRFCFNRLPFGISSASEIFQRAMSEILEGVDGVICHTDDILVHAPDKPTHDRTLREVLQRLKKAGLTLNEKCEFSKDSVKFLGHIIDATGVRIDPSKVEAINRFPQPTNIPELQRFMGMLNQQAKFIPNLAEITAPLRSLLRKDTTWTWDSQQEKAFQQAKTLIISPAVLAHYSLRRNTIIAADASNEGIGAVLYQTQDNGSRRPVCFISRSLTNAEKNYATIEKEALAVTWACERLTDYVLGRNFTVETDHKPLVPLLSSTELCKMPPRIQRFRLRLMRYNVKLTHVAGKDQTTADALSRAPAMPPSDADVNFLREVTTYAQQAIENLPATSHRLQEICDTQKGDPEISQVRTYCKNGWPAYMPHNTLMKQYWINRQHFSVVDDLLLFDNRLVIPRELRIDILNRLHEGHSGITKTRALASGSVWWPYISAQIEEMVNKCNICAIHRPEHKQPLLPSSFPERPWSRLGMDLFDFQGKTFIIVVDYYSRWVELRKLDNLSSGDTIAKLKSIFAVHGIPDLTVSDNGPQFASAEFRKFAAEFGFIHTTSSPRYPQSNGEAERAVRTVKHLLKKATDPYTALLLYRATPQHNGLSPSELLMGRKLKTKIPTLPSNLRPALPNQSMIREKEERYKEQQKRQFDKRYCARELPPLNVGDPVYIRDMNRPGEIVARHHNPRSFIIKTQQGTIRRNATHLVKLAPETANQSQNSQITFPSSPKSSPPIRPNTLLPVQANLQLQGSSSHQKEAPGLAGCQHPVSLPETNSFRQPTPSSLASPHLPTPQVESSSPQQQTLSPARPHRPTQHEAAPPRQQSTPHRTGPDPPTPSYLPTQEPLERSRSGRHIRRPQRLDL